MHFYLCLDNVPPDGRCLWVSSRKRLKCPVKSSPGLSQAKCTALVRTRFRSATLSGVTRRMSIPDAVEHTRPDASLYPQFSDTAYGFLSRGCPRNCGFCIVSGKEGRKSRWQKCLKKCFRVDAHIRTDGQTNRGFPYWRRRSGRRSE